MTLEDAITTDLAAVSELPVEQLLALIVQVDERVARTKQMQDLLSAALDRRYGARAKQCRAEAGKDTGTVRFADNDFTVIADLPKRVKWDQAKLRHAVEIIRTGWGDDPADYVKTKLDVSEAAFSNWPRPVRELFIPARTVETGRPVYRLERTGSRPVEQSHEHGGAARSARAGRVILRHPVNAPPTLNLEELKCQCALSLPMNACRPRRTRPRLRSSGHRVSAKPRF